MKGNKIASQDYMYHQAGQSHLKYEQREDQSFISLCCTSIKEGIDQIRACFSNQDREGDERSNQGDKSSSKCPLFVIAIVLFALIFFYVGGLNSQTQSNISEQTVEISQPLPQIIPQKEVIAPNESISPETVKPISVKTQSQKSTIFASPFIDQIIERKSLLKLSSFKSTYSKDDMEVAQKYWLFLEDSRKQNYYDSLMTSNNRYFAEESGYKFQVVSYDNYHDHVSQQYRQKLNKVMKMLRQRILLPEYKDNNLKYHIKSVEKRLAMLAILYTQGGIMASERVILTETFEWLRRIRDEVLVNRANANEPPQVFAFHSPYYSELLAKQKLMPRQGLEEVDKYVVASPALQGYFIAAKPQAAYIRDLFDTIVQFMVTPELAENDLKKKVFINRKMGGGDIYYEYFVLASLKVVQMKQKYLDQIYDKEQYRHFAIDYYGLETMNCHYSPFKISSYWSKMSSPRLFQFMARTPIKEYYSYAGPVRYLEKSKMGNELAQYIERIKNNQQKKGIMRGSYLQKVLYPKSRENFIYDNKEKPTIHYLAKTWDIPKIIWVYVENGIHNARTVSKLSFDNIKRYGQKSGFVLNEVNENNIKKYLTADVLFKIQEAVKKAKAKNQVNAELKSYLIRLALLARHGGVYIDITNILVDNLDWLIRIGKYSTDQIMNRYGDFPNVLMFWDPLEGSPVDWQIDAKANTKSQWLLSYQNNFIAAVKQNEFITNWFQMYLKLAGLSYDDIEKQFKSCKIFDFKLTTGSNFEYLASDAAKCVLGIKQQELVQTKDKLFSNACDYYKLWSMNSYLGQLKFRFNSNVEDDDVGNPILYYRYSRKIAESFAGHIKHFIKLNGKVKDTFNDLILRSLNQNVTTFTHSNSIFMKYVYSKTLVQVQEAPKDKN